MLLVAGEGDDRPRLEALIAELGRGDRSRLPRPPLRLRRCTSAMDVFALSSLREGLPNVVLEAMALEVPVVATRIAGVPRLIEDGQQGLLVEPGDASALAEAINRLIESEPLRQRLAAAARQRVEQRFSFAVPDGTYSSAL